MLEISLPEFPAVDDAGIERAVLRILGQLRPDKFVNPRIVKFDSSGPLTSLKDKWLVSLSIEEPECLASTSSMRVSVCPASGLVCVLDWDHTEVPVGRIVGSVAA